MKKRIISSLLVALLAIGCFANNLFTPYQPENSNEKTQKAEISSEINSEVDFEIDSSNDYNSKDNSTSTESLPSADTVIEDNHGTGYIPLSNIDPDVYVVDDNSTYEVKPTYPDAIDQTESQDITSNSVITSDETENQSNDDNDVSYYTFQTNANDDSSDSAAPVIPSFYTSSAADSTYSSISDQYAVYPNTRNQGNYGTCWAFSTIAAAEYYLITHGYANQNIDLSELQLSYFAFNNVADPLGGTTGDTIRFNPDASPNYLDNGGHPIIAIRSALKWAGLSNESVAPYSNAASTLNSGLSSSLAYNNNSYIMTDYRVLNIVNNPDKVKEEIMQNGAVIASYYDNGDYSSDDDTSYYCPTPEAPNHAIAIVGWDDNYSKTNFKNTPSTDGAWLVRNSWTTNPNDINRYNYFWLSYDYVVNPTFPYLKNIDESVYSVKCVPASTYNNNYQYDGGEVYSSTNYKKIANVYTANGSKSAETIKSVSVSTSDATNCNYVIDVYTNLSDPNNPFSGTHELKASTTVTTNYAGVYNTTLASPVTVNHGESFAIVVTMNSGKIDQEYDLATAFESTDIISSRVTAAQGQSYYYENNQWKDLSTITTDGTLGNFCVKAFTTNTDSAVNKNNNKTGLVYQDGQYCYLKNGKVDTTYTGFCSYNNNIYYVENGYVNTNKSQMREYKNEWRYIDHGVINFSYTGMAENQYGWWYFTDGRLNWTYTGVGHNQYGDWLYVNGRIDWGAYGMRDTNEGWKFAEGGRLINYTGMAENQYGWWYYQNGNLDWNYTGMACNEYGWWFYRDGRLDWTYTGMACNEYGWWFYRDGRLDWNYTGMACNEYGWWFYRDGRLDWNYTGMACNEYGWWFYRDGRLDWNYTGMACNEYGWWFYRNGSLDWTYTGFGYNEYGTWLYYNGRIAWDYTGWWGNNYIEGGKVLY